MPTDQDIIVRSLGDDGGARLREPRERAGPRRSCYDQLTNGADFVGRRPVIVDRRVIAGRGC